MGKSGESLDELNTFIPPEELRLVEWKTGSNEQSAYTPTQSLSPMAVQHGSAGIFDPPGGGVSNGNSDFVFPRGNGSCEMGRHTAYDLHAHDSIHQNDLNSHLYASADASADFPEKSIAQRLLEWSGLSIADLPRDLTNSTPEITPRDFEVGEGTQGPNLENPNFIGPTRKHGRGTPHHTT